jgi:IMP cyclohydrolase
MDGKGSLKMPSVVASVIYAETIKAGSVTADNIYVREVERR